MSSQSSPNNKKNGISRRKFLGNSAALIGGALVSPLSISRSAYAAGSDVLKLGLIGCGGRGTGATVQALRTEGAVELVAMADVFRDKLDSSYDNLQRVNDIKENVNVPEERKFIGFDAYKKVIEESDVVILATPPAFRPYHFEESIRAGKHVFMEKPLSSDAPGIRKILEAGKVADEKNLSVVVGLQNRYDEGYIELVNRLKDGAIGDIVSAKCNYLIGDLTVHPRQPDQTELEFQMRNWHYFNWLWAGAPAGLMIHYTDIVHWVKGSYPVRAHGIGGRAALGSSDHGDIFDTFYTDFEYEDGTRLHSEIRYIDECYFDRSVTFQGTEGTANQREGIKNRKGEVVWEYRNPDAPNPYQVEHDKLFASIRNGNPINDTEWAAKSSLGSIISRMAVHSGQMIEWDEALQSDLQLVPENLTFDSEPPIQPDQNGNYPVPVPGKTNVL